MEASLICAPEQFKVPLLGPRLDGRILYISAPPPNKILSRIITPACKCSRKAIGFACHKHENEMFRLYCELHVASL